MVSAIWHGFYPSYYIAFLHWGFVSTLARYFYKLSMNYPNFDYSNPVYKMIKFFIPLIPMNYFGVVFLNLRISTVLKFFNNCLWIPNIVLYLLMAFFTFTGL